MSRTIPRAADVCYRRAVHRGRVDPCGLRRDGAMPPIPRLRVALASLAACQWRRCGILFPTMRYLTLLLLPLIAAAPTTKVSTTPNNDPSGPRAALLMYDKLVTGPGDVDKA